MIRISIGVLIFLIGFFSFLAANSSPEGGTIWTGGMIVGGLLVLSGARKLYQERQY